VNVSQYASTGVSLLGIALLDMANYDEAEQAIARAIELFPPSKRHMGILQMGYVHEQRGDYEQAMSWYRRMIESLPEDNRGYVYLGGMLAKQGRLREAEEVHRTATERCDKSRGLEEAFHNLGLVLRAQERYEEAANCFSEAIRIDPKDRPARKALGDVERCLKESGKLARRSPQRPSPGVRKRKA